MNRSYTKAVFPGGKQNKKQNTAAQSRGCLIHLGLHECVHIPLNLSLQFCKSWSRTPAPSTLLDKPKWDVMNYDGNAGTKNLVVPDVEVCAVEEGVMSSKKVRWARNGDVIIMLCCEHGRERVLKSWMGAVPSLNY